MAHDFPSNYRAKMATNQEHGSKLFGTLLIWTLRRVMGAFWRVRIHPYSLEHQMAKRVPKEPFLPPTNHVTHTSVGNLGRYGGA